MKPIKFILIILFAVNVLITASTPSNNLEYSIKNKIINYLSTTYNYNIANLVFNMPSLEQFNDYRLYEISIIDVRTFCKAITFKLKISDFFDQNKYEMISVKTGSDSFSYLPGLVNNHNVYLNKIIKIYYKTDCVTISDTGTIKKIYNSDKVRVQNSFGKSVNCQLISNDSAEVIE